MPFTQDDCRKEILLKLLIAEAWGRTDPPSPPSDEDRVVLAEWMNALCVEGPECGRVSALLDTPVDRFQAELYESELRAMLHGVSNASEAVAGTLDAVMGNRTELRDLEKRLKERVETLLEDQSGIEQLLQRLHS